MAGNSGGYVKGTWSWVGGGRGEDGRESRGVEEMTGLWEESDGTGGAATSDQREKAPGGLAGWAAGRQVESGERWTVAGQGWILRWAQTCSGQWTGPPSVLDPPRCGHLNPHQNSFPAQPVSNDHRTKRARVKWASAASSRPGICVESRVSLGVALQFVQSGRLKSNAPRDAHAGVWGLGAHADAGRDSWTTQKPATANHRS